jgi:hypothetical protein
MAGGNIIGPVILLLFFVVPALVKKILSMVQEQAKPDQGERGTYEATPDEIADFLRSIERGRAQAQPEAGPRPAAGEPGRPAGGVAMQVPEAPAAPAMPEAAALVRPTLRRPARAPKQRAEAPARAASAGRARTAKPRKRTRRTRRPAQQAPRTAKARPAKKGKGVRAVVPAKRAPATPRSAADLRQAVIWSEILGPPVSVRRRRGRK